MEVNELKLSNEMWCEIKFDFCLDKIAAETIKLMGEVSNDKYFGEFTIFRWHGDFVKSIYLQLVLKPDLQESGVKKQNTSTVLGNLQENK